MDHCEPTLFVPYLCSSIGATEGLLDAATSLLGCAAEMKVTGGALDAAASVLGCAADGEVTEEFATVGL